ncbi:MAG TPA: FxsA family protein, partial [Longimicrobiales bacterium]|nr:FxsA family protein [Longimicrobiales bacterium]
MSLLARLTLLFVVVPILELVLLIQIGRMVGLLPTLALVLTTGLAGAALARAEGLRVLWAFRSEMASGRLPGQALLDGFSVLLGGAFLLTPGVLTDLAGLALLVPASRRWIQRRARASPARGIRSGDVRFVGMGSGPFGPPGPAAPRGTEDR